MGKNMSRLITAALLSLSVYGGTYYWYKSTASRFESDTNVKPVAYVSHVNEDVHRRPVTRLIWQLLSMGEPLYPGEAIRTSAKGEVRIQFAEGDRSIDLEPDSLIVISQSKNEISLDLMNGSIFVSQGTKNSGPALTLNSTKGKVDLSHATASLSKSSSGALDVQILKGSAKTNDGRELSNTQSAIQILSPQLDKPSPINPENIKPILFSWRGTPSPSIISLWIGTTRKDLKEAATALEPKENKIERKLPVGKYFWKIVVVDPVTKKMTVQSQIYRLEVVARYAPSPVFPQGEDYLQTAKNPFPVGFQWRRPEQARAVQIEVAGNESLKEKVFVKTFSSEDTFTQSLPPGDYFWRLSAHYEGLTQPIAGKVFSFTISPKPQKPKVAIRWLTPQEKPQYFVGSPELKVTWTSEQKDLAKKWKMVVMEDDKFFETSKMDGQIKLAKPGRYTASIEAYDEKGRQIGKSESRTFQVTPLPLLKAPKFKPETGDLKANNDGQLNLEWTSLDGAKEYYVSLRDKAGKELKKAKFLGTTTPLVNLMPGEYRLEIYAIDQYGRDGEHSELRILKVPDLSNLKAPKLKKVKVN